MKILIDFTQITVQKTGIGIYAYNLISAIYKTDKENYYYLLVQDDDNSFDYINDSRWKIIKVKSRIFRKLILRIFLQQLYIPYLVLKYRIDVTHSMHYSFPILSPAKKITTIPDMTFLKFPQYHILIKVIYIKTFIYLIPIFADKIITISESSRRDILQKFNLAKTKVHIIYPSISDMFRCDFNKDKIEFIRNKYNLKDNYILFIGTIEPRKNIENLILAFEKISKEYSNYQLVIVGKKGWHCDGVFNLVEKLSLTGKVIFTGFIDEEEKPFLLAGAKVFVYPSIYEGFGIPVLEALACRIPTITSNTSSLPEVAGNATLLIDPYNIEELYSNIKKLLDDPDLCTQLKQKSIEQAKKFSWEESAQETIKVYNSLQ